MLGLKIFDGIETAVVSTHSVNLNLNLLSWDVNFLWMLIAEPARALENSRGILRYRIVYSIGVSECAVGRYREMKRNEKLKKGRKRAECCNNYNSIRNPKPVFRRQHLMRSVRSVLIPCALLDLFRDVKALRGLAWVLSYAVITPLILFYFFTFSLLLTLARDFFFFFYLLGSQYTHASWDRYIPRIRCSCTRVLSHTRLS